MSTNSITYPYLAMNHHAIMLLMMKMNLRFISQVQKALRVPVRPLPPILDPDPGKPLAYLYTGSEKAIPVGLDELMKGVSAC